MCWLHILVIQWSTTQEMVQIHGLLVQLIFLGSFVIWFSWMIWRWVKLLVSFLYQLMSFLFKHMRFQHSNLMQSLTFEKHFDQWILFFWIFVLSFFFENSRSKFVLKLMQLVCRFEIKKHLLNWTSLVFWWCFLQCHSISAVFLNIKSVRIVNVIVCSKLLVWLFPPAQDAIKLACQNLPAWRLSLFVFLATTASVVLQD